MNKDTFVSQRYPRHGKTGTHSPPAQELEKIVDNLARLLAQGKESRTEALLREYGLIGLVGRMVWVPIRVTLFLGGLASAFTLGSFSLNKWSGNLQSLEGLLLGGTLSAIAFWLLLMRRFPFLAPLLSIGILLGILVRGGSLRGIL